jgi:hypothetical protein
VKVKVFGKHQILDTVCSQWGYNCNNVVIFGLMLLFFVNGTFGKDFQGL